MYINIINTSVFEVKTEQRIVITLCDVKIVRRAWHGLFFIPEIFQDKFFFKNNQGLNRGRKLVIIYFIDTYLKVYSTLFKKHVFPKLDNVAIGFFRAGPAFPPYWLPSAWWPFNIAVVKSDGFNFFDNTISSLVSNLFFATITN